MKHMKGRELHFRCSAAWPLVTYHRSVTSISAFSFFFISISISSPSHLNLISISPPSHRLLLSLSSVSRRITCMITSDCHSSREACRQTSTQKEEEEEDENRSNIQFAIPLSKPASCGLNASRGINRRRVTCNRRSRRGSARGATAPRTIRTITTMTSTGSEWSRI